jgi:hypothetical protein
MMKAIPMTIQPLTAIKANEANRPAMIKNIAAPILGHIHPNPNPIRNIDINIANNVATLLAIHLNDNDRNLVFGRPQLLSAARVNGRIFVMAFVIAWAMPRAVALEIRGFPRKSPKRLPSGTTGD